MRWPRVESCRRRWAAGVALVLVALSACDRGPGRNRSGQAGDRPGADSGRALQLADPELYATCDSLQQWVRAVAPRAQRTDGRFTGAARGATRFGCRITASDMLAPDVEQRPLEVVWQSLAARGWTVEQSYVADSPEGSMLGMRSGVTLCVLQHSWQTGSDDERAARPDVPVPYELAVECFREASRQAAPTG
jgi:hypothetical protein